MVPAAPEELDSWKAWGSGLLRPSPAPGLRPPPPPRPPHTHIWLLHARSLWVLSPCSHSLFLNRIFPQKEGVSLTLFPPYLLPLLTAHLNTIFSLGLFELAFLFMAL